ncbi:MAG: HlyD family efflux transporter periplasmic adaptor subunit [Phycisphaerae bacterium]|nr:HlyD family efflux transporter periplasmic adaptor subunit [Phycisphaerae bacterium]
MDQRVQYDRRPGAQATPSTSELIEHLSCFAGAPNEFLLNLLAVQCHLASATSGAVIRPREDGQVQILAAFPPLPKDAPAPPVWLAQAVESGQEIMSRGVTAVRPLRQAEDLYGQPATRWMVLLPIKRVGHVEGLAVFVMENTDQSAIEAGRQKLELTVSLLSLYEMRLLLQSREVDLERLQRGMGVLSSINTQSKFAGAAMAMCNEIAARWNADRVGYGILKGRYVQLKAMSHTEKFSRKMKLVQEIEGAMEECLDQDIEVYYPSPADATYVSRAAGTLSKHHGPASVVSLPLRNNNEPVAVLTVERAPDNPVNLSELETLRLLGDLATARLMNLHERDRWFGAKIAGGVRKFFSWLLGAKHTWLKLIALGVIAAALFLTLAKGDYQAEAPCLLEATERRVVPAPFDGFLKDTRVDPSDPKKNQVQKGGVLGELHTTELMLELLDARKEKIGYETQAKAALEAGKIGEQKVALAQAAGAEAKIQLLEYRLEKAKLLSPVEGYVIVGDLKKQLGAPVKTGDVLYEVAPLDSLRAELNVPEDQIPDVKIGQRGELAVAAKPDERVGFVVEKIFPLAEVKDQQNVFRVQVKLDRRVDWMRPGMEGLAKIHIDKRSYAWIWTRKLRNWIRMKFW